MPTEIGQNNKEALDETLSIGNTTANGQEIVAQNGGGALSLRFANTDGLVLLTNDLSGTFGALVFNKVSQTTQISQGDGITAGLYYLEIKNNSIGLKHLSADTFSFMNPASIEHSDTSNHFISSVRAIAVFSANVDRTCNGSTDAVFLNTGNFPNVSTYKANVQRSVIASGQGITAKTDDSLYCNQLALQFTGNTFEQNIRAVNVTADRTYQLQDTTVGNNDIALVGQGVGGIFAQTVQSATINTIGEQSITGTGVGTLSVPANIFKVGDSFHAKIGGVINATGGGGRSEITFNIKNGASVLATSGVFDLDDAINEAWELELDFTINSIGASGTIATNGNFEFTKTNDRKLSGTVFQDIQTIDTTVVSTLDITVEWNVLNSGDDIYSSNFVLYKTFGL
jgi:hypothetical protein